MVFIRTAPLLKTLLCALGVCGTGLWLENALPQPAHSAEPVRNAADRTASSLPAQWPLRAMDVDGNIHRLGESPTTIAYAFLFLSPRCERSVGYLPVLERLANAYSDNQVELFAVVSDPDVDRAELRAWRDRDHLHMNVLFDPGGVLAAELGATHTPQAVVVDTTGHRVYSGKIDDRPDRPGDKRVRAKQTYLATVLRSLVAGRPPLIRKTEPVGRSLSRRSVAEQRQSVTWARHIAPLVAAHCAECHHDGGQAPFPLTTLDEVRPHAHAIVPLLRSRQMPPWKPSHGFAELLNVRRLSQTEIELFAAWVDADTPAGNEEELPPRPDFGDGWLLGEPDLVFEPFEAGDPTVGTLEFPEIHRSFVWPVRLAADRLVSAIEFRPGQVGAITQATVQIDTTGIAQRCDRDDPLPGFNPRQNPQFTPAGTLGGWAPVTVAGRLPTGSGRVLPQNSDIVLQLAYRSPRDITTTRPKLGVYLAPESARRPVGELIVADLKLRIPAGASRHRHRARFELPTATTILGLTPHLRDLGKELTVIAILPDGTTDRLLRIDDWDPAWHDHYLLRRPVRLPEGTRLEFEAVFDNSAKNPRQPANPPRPVHWGDGPGEESAICFLQVSTDTPTDFADLMRQNTAYVATQLSSLGTLADSPRENALPPSSGVRSPGIKGESRLRDSRNRLSGN